MKNILFKYLDCFVTIRTAQSNFEGVLQFEEIEEGFYLIQFNEVIGEDYFKDGLIFNSGSINIAKTYFNIDKIESITINDEEYERVLTLKKEKEEKRIKDFEEEQEKERKNLTVEEFDYFKNIQMKNKDGYDDLYVENEDGLFFIYYTPTYHAIIVDKIINDSLRIEEMFIKLFDNEISEDINDFLKIEIKKYVNRYIESTAFNPFAKEEE